MVIKIDDAYKLVNSSAEGLNESGIKEKKNKYGIHTIKSTKRQTSFLLFLNQFKNPITVILLLASVLSYTLQDKTNAIINCNCFYQQRAWLLAGESSRQCYCTVACNVRITANIIRDKTAKEIPVEEIVPGDIVVLDAGGFDTCRLPFNRIKRIVYR